MHLLTKPSIILAFSVLLLASCSTSNLQGNRLQMAEDSLLTAERAATNKKVTLADEQLGVSTAFLATLNDNKKRLTESQLKKYKTLLQRNHALAGKVRTMKQ